MKCIVAFNQLIYSISFSGITFCFCIHNLFYKIINKRKQHIVIITDVKSLNICVVIQEAIEAALIKAKVQYDYGD